MAPGPDGISLKDLVRLDPNRDMLEGLFNKWLITGIIPDGIKEGPSLLIPKMMDQEQLKDIANWRPLIICCGFLRMLKTGWLKCAH